MNDYLCPKCNGQLRVGNEIIFSTKTSTGAIGIMLFSPKIGDYSVVTHPSFSVSEGEHVSYLCPLCHENLTASEYGKDLAKVICIDEKRKQSVIIFSEVVGQKCTYKIYDNHLQSFGDDSQHYMNFFGEMPSFYE